MGNLYNVEQHVNPTTVAGSNNATTAGLEAWKAEMRKQVMKKLKNYAPNQVDAIIKATFGSSKDTQGF